MMGWKSRLGGVAKKAGGVALQGATGGLASALVQEHGEELGALIEKVDRLAAAAEGGIVTKEQADRIEHKLDKVLRMVGEVHADHFGEGQ